MKKKTIKILTCFLLGGLMLVSCNEPGTSEPTPSHTHSWENEWKHDDSNHWHSCKDSTCGEISGKEAHVWDSGVVTKAPTEESTGEKTYECTVCDATKIEEISKLEHTHKFAEEWSKDSTHHWHSATCDHETEISDKAEHSGGTATFVSKAQCEVCGEAYGDFGEFDESILVPGTNEELVEYKVNVSANFETGTSTTDILKEKFTLVGGTEVRARTKVWTNPDDPDEKIEFTKSIKLGSKTSEVKAEVPGVGLLSLWVQNGSSGAATQKISVTDPQGKVTEIEFTGVDGGSPVVKLDIPVKPGTYSIKRVSGTVDIFNMELKSVVAVAPESGFEIASAGKVDFLEGEEFDYSKLVVNKVYGNGRTEDLDLDDTNFSIDSSEYKANVPGTYTIKLNYKEYTQLTYQVVVYDIEKITLGFDAIEKLSSNSAAGNGVYFNHSVKEVYDLNEKFDITGLSVTVTGKNGEVSKDFRINPNDVTISGFDSSTAGKKDVTVTYNFAEQSVSKLFSVYVVDADPSKTEENLVKVKVDPSYTGNIGAVVDGYNMFTTIQQALDYIEDNAKIASSDRKLIELAPGTYTEKLEITIPYLTIKGSDASSTIIEWDSIYGVADAGGFVHTTDSTATVAIRDNAIGCTIEGVTISNWYNSQARMNERNMAIERALALLVQSDQFVMKNGQLLGIQDTLELFTGRQYFENVFISGYTDFIFGTNNTTYFKNCTVHTIDTEKDDKSTPGYLTAFKGSNKGASDYITYGAIFDDCDFTADDGVAKGTTAIGRTWGAYAAVAIINSNIGDHISVVGWNSSGDKGNRYVSMNGIKPTDATVQFVEYNNTGDGAISKEVAGMKMLTAEEAANYVDFDVIFGLTNGLVSYTAKWDPSSEEIAVDNNTYYFFNGQSSPTGTNYQYTLALQGSSGTGTLGNMTIDATAGKLSYRESNGDTQINAGTKLTLSVEAGDIVEVTTYSANGLELNGILATTSSYKVYYTEATTAEIICVSNNYLHSIKVLKGYSEADANATFTASEAAKVISTPTLSVNGLVISWEVIANAVSYQVYINGVEAGEPQVETTYTFNETTVGTYLITVKAIAATGYYDSKISEDVLIRVVEEGVDPTVIAENTKITFATGGDYINSVIDFSSIQVVENGDNCQVKNGSFTIKIKAGATVTIHGYPNLTSYKLQINDGAETEEIKDEYYSVTVDVDSIITYTPINGGNNYLKDIVVSFETTL